MPHKATDVFKVPSPGANAPVHEYMNWLAFCFAEHAAEGDPGTFTPQQMEALAVMFLELGERALRGYLALIKNGIEPEVPIIMAGNITSLPVVAAERARQATLALFHRRSPTPPNGGSAA